MCFSTALGRGEVSFDDLQAFHPVRMLLDQWCSAGRVPGPSGHPLPSWCGFDPASVKPALPWMFVSEYDPVPVEPDMPFTIRYRLCGTENAMQIGGDATGKTIRDVFGPDRAKRLISGYREVMGDWQPRVWLGGIEAEMRDHIPCYRALFPFVDRNGPVPVFAGIAIPRSEADEVVTMRFS